MLWPRSDRWSSPKNLGKNTWFGIQMTNLYMFVVFIKNPKKTWTWVNNWVHNSWTRWDPLDNPTAAFARAEGASPGRRIECHAVWRHLLVGLGYWGQYVSGFGVGTTAGNSVGTPLMFPSKSWSPFAYDMWDPAASSRGSWHTLTGGSANRCCTLIHNENFKLV